MGEHKKIINCRVCLRYDLEKSQECLSLFEKYRNSVIAEKIKYVANIEIRECDGLPGKICPDCLVQLETAIVFKQKCETSNKILLSIVQQPSKICKVTFRVPVKNEVDVVFEKRTECCCINHSTGEIQTKKHEISQREMPQYDITVIEPAEDAPNTEKLANKTSVKANPVNRDVTVLPIKNRDVTVLPIKNRDVTVLPIKNTDVNVLPIKNTDVNVLPIKNTDVTVLPIKNRDVNVLPMKNTDVNVLPIKNRDVNVITTKNKELEYEISNSEVQVIGTQNDEQSRNETLEKEDENHKSHNAGITAGVGKPSRAIDLKLICDDCGESFKSKCKLAAHWKKVHLPNKLICPSCKRIFKSYKAFHVHKMKNTRSCQAATKVRIEGLGRKRVFHCLDCDYSTLSIKDMDAHIAIHSGVKRFQCMDCLKCFTQHSSLQGHRESIHKDYLTVTTCHYCGKVVQGRNKFYKHLRQHEPKIVQCEVCNKTLKSRANLINHMKRHTGIRSYTCEICPAGFFTMGELCNHRRRVHFKAKTFKCEMCEYSAHTADSLKVHRSRHTQDNVVCLICGIFVENEEKLVEHQRRHDEKNFCCPDCDKGFFRRDSLRRHAVKKHGAQKKIPTYIIALNTIPGFQISE